MRLRAAHVRVRVPATSANLGPGFDALGLALGLHDELDVRAVASPGVRVEVEGEGAGQVPDDERHLVVRALRAALDRVGAPQTGLHLVCRNRIPHGRGLGSSAAAVVAGVLAARGLVGDPDVLGGDDALALATELEGHPDNAAPALLGGLTLAWTADGEGGGTAGVRAVRLPVHDDVAPLAVVPPQHLSTHAARGVLPAQVPHADAAWQAGRAGLLVEALGRRPDLLLDATGDRLHQGYRRSVMPESLALVDALRARGVAAVVSGAGPTVLALARGGDATAGRAGDDVPDGRATDADAAVADAFGGVMAGWRVLRLPVDDAGATVRALLD
ncbi:homoserine kinase [Cellulomonas telluris]|uniref:homoserine kinase n=1 Tax=Cellulomonas telluris TaxID=2306636 RepID=UPI0010A927C8|nr:homoserine kinase [Cellulomonas telluris]